MKPYDADIYGVFYENPGTEYHQDNRQGAHASLTRIRAILLVALCFLPVIYQLLLRFGFKLSHFFKLPWNVLVYLIPSRLLDAIESHINPLQIRNPTLDRRLKTNATKIETMRRILNLSIPGDFLGSFAPAERKQISSRNTVAQETDNRPAGLGNWDNSCYQNSVLQGLASLNSLLEYLNKTLIEMVSAGKGSGEDLSDPNMAEALRSLIENLNNPLNNGKSIWTPAPLKNMSSWQQQDAQEYFSKVLDEIDREVCTTVSSKQNFAGPLLGSPKIIAPDKLSFKTIRNPLEGLIAQRVGCLRCEFSEGLSLIPFNCLTLPLGRFKDYDISECLDEYTKLELIEGVECGKCTLIAGRNLLYSTINKIKEYPRNNFILEQNEEILEAMTKAIQDDDYDEKTLLKQCKLSTKTRVTSTKSRQAVIARSPRSLVIHFNRSLYDEVSGDLKKNCCQVKFPKILDLGPWCIGSTGNVENLSTEEWIMNPDWSMVAGSRKLSRQKGPSYELRAVITHYGRHENGHYVCYKKYPILGTGDEQDRWWRLSDDEVMRVSEENVLGQGGVFMLFYDCIDPAGLISSEAPNIKHAKTPENSSVTKMKSSQGLFNLVPNNDTNDSVNTEDVSSIANISFPHNLNDDLFENEKIERDTCRHTPGGIKDNCILPMMDEMSHAQNDDKYECKNAVGKVAAPKYRIWDVKEIGDAHSNSRKGGILAAGSTLLMVK